ncbi:MAG: ABC transporter substrate-binding protein [Chloroflexota bacterium]|nr:ABC transporter substrate-binding protein [Chloroflexota bacterium]
MLVRYGIVARRGMGTLLLALLLTACNLSADPTPTVVSPPTATVLAVATALPLPSPTANGPRPGPTPISAWRPGAHRGTIPAPATLVRTGTLTVGSDVSYPPQEYFDGAGHPVGFDIDVADEMAGRLGLTLTVVNAKFDDIIMNLNNGQYDALFSAMTIKPEREQVVQFVPYFSAGQAVLVAAGNPQGIHTLEDLAGKTVATEQGTSEEDTLRVLNTQLEAAGKAKVTVRIYPTDTEAVDQLRRGGVVATLHDSPVAAYYVTLDPTAFAVGIPAFASAPEGIAVAKGNTALFQALDSALRAMQADGTLAAIQAKWGLK